MTFENVTINILNFNKADLTLSTIKHVLKSKIGKAKIQVLDNASTDDDYAKLKQLLAKFPRVKLLRKNPPNIGFAGGHSYLLKHTKTRFVVMLNNDVIVSKNWLVNLMSGFLNNKHLGIAGPQVNYSPPLSLNLSTINVLFRHTKYPPKNGPETFMVEGPCMLVDLKKIPAPFDPDYYIYNEDSYLSFQTRLLGYNVGHITKSRIFHYGSVTTTSDSKNRFYLYYAERNRLWNVLILFRYATIIRLLPLILIDIAVYLLKIALKRPITAFKLAGCYIETIMRFKEIAHKHSNMQKKKKTSDKEILREIYGAMLENNSMLGRIVNAFALFYLRLVGVKTAEHYL